MDVVWMVCKKLIVKTEKDRIKEFLIGVNTCEAKSNLQEDRFNIGSQQRKRLVNLQAFLLTPIEEREDPLLLYLCRSPYG